MEYISKVKEILGKKVNVSTLKEDDNLTDLGLDSLDLVETMIEIEEELGIEFTSEEIANLKTLKDVTLLIEKKL